MGVGLEELGVEEFVKGEFFSGGMHCIYLYESELFKQRIHLKHQVLFSLKNTEKIFINVVCCSRDWPFKG